MPLAYLDEEDVWKCPSHPSKLRPYGVCPNCLRDKLSSLCPDCASLRPCSCSSSDSSTSSSSSSSSSSFSRFFSSRSSSAAPDRFLNGKVSNLVGSEPSSLRTRSVATLNLPSFLRSLSKFPGRDMDTAATVPPASAKTATSFWGKFLRDRSKRSDRGSSVDEDRRTMMRKSRSVAAGYNYGNFPDGGKGRGWSSYFPSPMKMFGIGPRTSELEVASVSRSMKNFQRPVILEVLD